MACSRCGKFTLFRDLCSSCERTASGSRVVARFGSSRQIKWQWKAKILKVSINGAERTLDATSGLGEEVMQELASHLGMEIPELQNLLHLGHVNQTSGGTVTRSQAGQTPVRDQQASIVNKRVTLIECPKCHHKIAESAWCLYCGNEIVPATAVRQPVNEVDREFLENDVKAENKNTSAAKQPLRDSFSDRLKDM